MYKFWIKATNSIIISILLMNCAYAGFKEHYDLGQEYLSNYQYSGAITEFKNALRINFMDKRKWIRYKKMV